MQPKYQVCEIYRTIQGEGWHTGLPCTLVRLQGCDLHCSFCDTKYSIDPKGGEEMTLDELVERIEKVHRQEDIILITGGEPTLQPIGPLAVALKHLGPVHLETAGHHVISEKAQINLNWITASPKTSSLEGALAADEIKWLVSTLDDIVALDIYIQRLKARSWKILPKISLQPISQDPKATKIAYEACLRHGYRLSIQTQKLIGVK